MTSLKFDMKINSSLHKKLDEYRVRKAMIQALTETGIELNNTLSKDPTPKKTGNLRRSNSYEVTPGNTPTLKVKNSAPYWVYVNFGTSRMKKGGKHFLEQAVAKVQPEQKVVSTFKKLYKP